MIIYPRTGAYLSVAAALLAGAVAARANTVVVSAYYTGDSPTETVNVKSPYLASPYTNTWVDVYAGASNFSLGSVTDKVTGAGDYTTNLTASDVLGVLDNHFVGYCIDLNHLISPSNSQVFNWEVTDLTNVSSGVNGMGITTAQATAIEYLWGTHGPATESAEHAATFQMALWMLLYDTGGTYGATETNVSFSGNAEIATAASWALDAWDGNFTKATDVFALVNVDTPPTQSFSFTIVGFTPNIPPAVPLPAAADVGFGMLAGFGALFVFRKRLSRKSRIA